LLLALAVRIEALGYIADGLSAVLRWRQEMGTDRNTLS
jgi:hypothetical protein